MISSRDGRWLSNAHLPSIGQSPNEWMNEWRAGWPLLKRGSINLLDVPHYPAVHRKHDCRPKPSVLQSTCINLDQARMRRDINTVEDFLPVASCIKMKVAFTLKLDVRWNPENDVGPKYPDVFFQIPSHWWNWSHMRDQCRDQWCVLSFVHHVLRSGHAAVLVHWSIKLICICVVCKVLFQKSFPVITSERRHWNVQLHFSAFYFF